MLIFVKYQVHLRVAVDTCQLSPTCAMRKFSGDAYCCAVNVIVQSAR